MRIRGTTCLNSSPARGLLVASPRLASPRLASPRLRLPAPFGLSLGGALGYHQVHQEDATGGFTSRAFVFAPRAGYFLRPLPELGIWPRAGLTPLSLDDRQRENETAMTLELPVLWLLAEGQLGIALLRQYLPGNGYSTPRVAADYLFELGLSFGGALAYGTFDVDRAP